MDNRVLAFKPRRSAYICSKWRIALTGEPWGSETAYGSEGSPMSHQVAVSADLKIAAAGEDPRMG